MSEAVKIDGIFDLTIPVQSSFPHVVEPKPYMEKGKAKGDPMYSLTLHFTPDNPDLIAMKKLAAKIARIKWPDKKFVLETTDGQKIPQVHFPFISGDVAADKSKAKGKDGEYMRGKVLLQAKSMYAPRLSYLSGKKIVDLENETAILAAKDKFYPGVEVLAQLNFAAYDAIGDAKLPGVKAYLNIVLSTCKGARMAGGKTGSQTFKGYVGSVSAEDPTAGVEMLDDEIPY